MEKDILKKCWQEVLMDELDGERISEEESTKNEIKKLFETKLSEVKNE